ncbi:DNA photolyase family protein [Acetobacter sp. TBRC 12305]|uniref:Deoxyribodipyrimidine photo-lyase n=1 Tax=Acetobacter garciniae TaxID=2817435 RepID=A0A939HLQ7_9PROT|nr:deoxyribodipyrimidine photo-lyase [Acetobacter garciniae]MBX0346517.1 DNA photolyase family protein [Acetobacter garciniae]
MTTSYSGKSGDKPVIVWFRDDLRLADNPALHAAAETGLPVLCVFVHDPALPLGRATRWWLDGALRAFQASITACGGELLVLHGPTFEIMCDVLRTLQPAGIFWNRRYGLHERNIDSRVKDYCKENSIAASSFAASLLHEPWTVQTRAGGRFRVYTAWWRAVCEMGDPACPLAAPERLCSAPVPEVLAGRTTVDALALLPKTPDWAAGLRAEWHPGEEKAQDYLGAFLNDTLEGYATLRDRPAGVSTSRLSPYLRFGHLSPRQVWHATKRAVQTASHEISLADQDKFLSELGWRDFAWSLLFDRPDLASTNFRPEFDAMRWLDEPDMFTAWARGQTGYPLVDAGMRQLWITGWMHNRVRMVVASFLTKHLLIDWRKGARWFDDTLVDADPASNVMNWQWVAGSGVDAAPYFRVMNPVLQSEKFDPDGEYIKKFVPELRHLPVRALHAPWQASPAELTRAGVRLGETYPCPVVEHRFARERALAAWKASTG